VGVCHCRTCITAGTSHATCCCIFSAALSQKLGRTWGQGLLRSRGACSGQAPAGSMDGLAGGVKPIDAQTSNAMHCLRTRACEPPPMGTSAAAAAAPAGAPPGWAGVEGAAPVTAAGRGGEADRTCCWSAAHGRSWPPRSRAHWALTSLWLDLGCGAAAQLPCRPKGAPSRSAAAAGPQSCRRTRVSGSTGAPAAATAGDGWAAEPGMPQAVGAACVLHAGTVRRRAARRARQGPAQPGSSRSAAAGTAASSTRRASSVLIINAMLHAAAGQSHGCPRAGPRNRRDLWLNGSRAAC